MFQNSRILSVKDVKLLLVSVVSFTLAVLKCQVFVLLGILLIRLGGRDLVDPSEGPGSVDPSLDHLFVDSQSILLVLVEVSELTLELSHHEHLFSVRLHSEWVPSIVLEISSNVLGKTEGRELASVVVLTVGRCDLGPL